MSSVMSNVKIIEASFRARDAQLSARLTVLRLFLVQFSVAFGRHVSKIIFERFANEALCSSLLLSEGDCGHRYEFRTEDANSLSPGSVAIWFDGLPGSRKACLPPSCLAGPLSRFQGSKGWACLGSGARAVYPPFVFLSLKFASATMEERAPQVYNVWKHTNRGRSICPTTNFSATPARKHSRRS